MGKLSIEPRDRKVHFQLRDATPECSITLTQSDAKPLIYRVQPMQKHRYAVWPSVGVVHSGSQSIVSVVLLERARSALQRKFANVVSPDPVEEYPMDNIIVEWCEAPDTVYKRLGLMGDSDQDYEILSSFWNTRGYEFSTPVVSERQTLSVYFDTTHPAEISRDDTEHGQMDATTSMDESSAEGDPSLSCDDSLMLSVSTWGNESQRPSRHRISSHRGSHRSSATGTNPQALASKSATIHKFQLLQTLRCGGCYQSFSRDPNDLSIPVMSQACGHTICRGCVVRKADEDYEFAHAYQTTISCPLCMAPNAFSQELHMNHSLCSVIALLDS